MKDPSEVERRTETESLPRVLLPSQEHGMSEYQRLGAKRRRVEMKQLREVWRCTRDNVETDESFYLIKSGCWLVTGGDREVKE